MPPQNVLFGHRAFALAVKRIDLSTGQADWLVSGDPYRLNWTHQRIKIEILNGDPYIELDWTNVNAGEFPVTVTIRARLEDCCKTKEDSAVKFWSEGLEIAFPHHTDKKNWTYDCMTLSLGGVDFGKAQWSGGLVARLGKEDREFVQGLKTKIRDVEIVTCWSREREGDWSYLTPFEEHCAAINRTLQQRAAPPPRQQNRAAALPAPTPRAALPVPPPPQPQPAGPSRTRRPRMPFLPNGKLRPLTWKYNKPAEEETDEPAPVSDEAEARAKAELQERLSREPSRSRDDRKRSASVEEIENPAKKVKQNLENTRKDELKGAVLEHFEAVKAKMDIQEGKEAGFGTLKARLEEARPLLAEAEEAIEEGVSLDG